MAERKISIHQLPKSPGYLKCWGPRPGNVWIDFDVASLEQVVLAELSEDPALMKLYGPEAKPNQCVYLFSGASYPVVGDQIRKLYDPDNPPATAELLEEVKHKLKQPRGLAKRWKLGLSYGMRAGKLQRESRLAGVELTYEQAQGIVAADKRLYVGVTRWQEQLEQEWEDRGGWVYDGLGCPTCVCADKKKDLVNRVCQKTGHSILMQLVYIISKNVEAQKAPMWPVIVDFHDETIWEVPLTFAPRAVKLVGDSLARLNKELGGTIPMRGAVNVVHNLAEAKCE